MWGVIHSDGGSRRVHLAVTDGGLPLFYSPAILDDVDPFIGTAATGLPPPSGLAATWWWPKPQVGNTHPGATSPLGMVSACAYSGAYPTGYGRYTKNTEGVPEEMFERLQASGFTHFQQSGTGAIRKYYNYVRVTPMVQPLDELGRGVAAARRGGRAGLLRGHPGHRGALRDHRRREGRRAPVHVPGAQQRPGGGRPVLRRAGHRARPDGAVAGPGARAWATAAPRARW